MGANKTSRSLPKRVTSWVEDTLHNLAHHDTITYGNIKFDREDAETLAYAHTYHALERIATDPSHPYHDGARIALDGLEKPEIYGDDELPQITQGEAAFYADAVDWVEEDAYRDAVRQTASIPAQETLGITPVVADGGRTDGGEMPDGGITEEDIEVPEGIPADRWLDNLLLRLIGGAAVVTAATGGAVYALMDSDNDGLRNYEEWAGALSGSGPGAADADVVVSETTRTVSATPTETYSPTPAPTATATPVSTPDPATVDQDRDGFPDGVEARCLDDSNVSRMDVYVEIDRMEGVDNLSPRAEERIVDYFADAPVEGGGINLHIVYSDVVPATDSLRADEKPGTMNDFSDYYNAFYDHEGEGYHYMLLVDGSIILPHGGSAGGASPSYGTAMVDQTTGISEAGWENSSDTQEMNKFMHEFGHSLGLRSQFVGIDSFEISYEKYPSVMNRNAGEPYGEDLTENRFVLYGYSDGTNSEQDFDDWGYIEEHLDTLPTDAYWEDGELACDTQDVTD